MFLQAVFQLLSVFLACKIINAYNIAEELPIFKFGPENSKFGFSVALHEASENNSGISKTVLVTGAPTATESISSPKRTGGVFYCPVTTNTTDCERVAIGIREGESGGVRIVIDDQWLGVSLKSEGPGKNLVTCAHRYTEINMDKYNSTTEAYSVRMCGKCYLMKVDGSGELIEIPGSSLLSSPCKRLSVKSAWSRETYFGYSQTGISIALKDGQYFLGAPGTYSWTGAVFNINGEKKTASPRCLLGDGERFRTPVGRYQCVKIPVTTDSYLGMSLAISSAIDSGSPTTYYIAGAPRANDTGGILFFTKDSSGKLIPDITKSLVGDKITSSFGYSVAATDINDDDLDDVIVGVPQYFERSSERKVDGAVYIYINNASIQFRDIEPTKLYGAIDSFFGHAVAALGDIDQDGYNDFAVGAPSEDGKGVVHIFRGSEEKPVLSQSIKGSQYETNMQTYSREMKGFGSSLSTLVDVDNNNYPDLLVGTSSDAIVLFRSRPIIKLTADLNIMEEEVDLDQKSCRPGSTSYSCFEISFCFSYSTHASDSFPDGVRVKYELKLDNILQKAGVKSRVHFNSPDGEGIVTNITTIRSPGVEECLQGRPFVYVESNIKDKLTPIEIEFVFNIESTNETDQIPGGPVPDMYQYPILDGESDKAKKSILPIKNDCGDDGCNSDLKVTADVPEEIVLGKDNEITLSVDVSNLGEDAHQAMLHINLPNYVQYLRHESNENDTDMCFSQQTGISSYIKCNLGNPYKAGVNITINFELSTETLEVTQRDLYFLVELSTTSNNPVALPLSLKSRVVVELDLQLLQFGDPEQVRYENRNIKGESAMVSVEEIGPGLAYTFSIFNRGSQRSSGVSLVVDIPTEIFNMKWLLYLVSTKVEAGAGIPAGSCNNSYSNPLGLDVESISTRKKRSVPAVAQPVFARGEFGLITTVGFNCDENNARCTKLECVLDDIDIGATTTVKLQLRLWNATLLEEYREYDLVYIQTSAKLTTDDDSIRFKSDTIQGMISTTIDHGEFKSENASSFPWWFIVIALLLLIIIYIVVILLMIKYGFFGRRVHEHNDDENHDDEKKIDKEKKAEEEKKLIE